MLKVFTLLADWLTYEVAGLAPQDRWGDAMHFFVEDVSKILVLVTFLIFVIGVLRAGVDSERIRDFLSGKRRGLGYAMASGFGAVTPFCSCSSIPLFLGFTAARIPLGITMAFLITSPMINEVAIVLMGGLLGWRFLAVYVAIGLGAGMLGGAFLDRIGAERYLMPVGQAVMKNAADAKGDITASDKSASCGCTSDTCQTVSSKRPVVDFRSRLDFAAGETKSILKKIWIWVLVGVGLGSFIHGFVPESLISENLGRGTWWSVPAAVLLGIPLYGGASATVPVVGSLIAKGLPVGTATVFMMSVVAVSFPEFVMLKQVMKPRLLLIFFVMLLVFFTLAGWILNLVM